MDEHSITHGHPSMTDDEGEIGEQVETPYFTVEDSEIRSGDLVIFRYHHPAFASNGGWTELAGKILAVLPGHEQVYSVKVATTGVLRWPNLLVRRVDILRVHIRASA
ncbi:MAG: hypothetical protein OEY28_02460 [Nitrospira sp.]|nr:hypothetical protein [Nitrospira sp.]